MQEILEISRLRGINMKMGSKLGGIAFISGLFLAIVIAIFNTNNAPQWVVFVMALLGLVVGLLNIEDRETTTFLVAGIAFLLSFDALASVIESLAFGWSGVGTFLRLMTIFVAPATAVVALIAITRLAKD